MKKYFYVLIISFIIPSIAFASFNTPLSYGSSGNNVEQLQEFLISQDCLSTQPSGYFGSLTLAGVECFQTKFNLPSTGYFGNLSRAEANTILNTLTASSTEGQVAKISSTTVPRINCPSGWTCTSLVTATTSVITSGTVSSTPVVSPPQISQPQQAISSPSATVAVPLVSSGLTVTQQDQACQSAETNSFALLNAQISAQNTSEAQIESTISTEKSPQDPSIIAEYQASLLAYENGAGGMIAGSGVEGQQEQYLKTQETDALAVADAQQQEADQQTLNAKENEISTSNNAETKSIESAMQTCLSGN